MAIEPYKTFSVGDFFNVEVYGKPHNWSMYTDISWRNLHSIADHKRVHAVLSPTPIVFNARICDPNDLEEYRIMGVPHDAVKICRTPNNEAAEGTVIPKGTAFWTTSADCPMILMYDSKTGYAAATHSGRDSLIDVDHLFGKKSRKNYSVIDGLVSEFKKTDKADLRVFFVCRISAEHFPHPFNHPEKGERNRLIINEIVTRWGRECIVGELEQGNISLSLLILKQCMAHGIVPEHVSDAGLDTYMDENVWSHRRGEAGRNGILVIHKN